jgi:hypothetical protein
LSLRVVHEGRGGYVELDERRYPIELVEGGRFCIHFSGHPRDPQRARHLAALEQLVRDEPQKWAIERR